MDIEFYKFIIAAIVIIVYAWYIILIKRRNAVLNALSGIDVQLRRRHDLIPNLVSVASKFMEFEKTILTDITNIRSEAIQKYNQKDAKEVDQHFKIEKALSDKLANIMINAENYPVIKSDSSMLEIQRNLQDIEENLSAARRFYNSAVMELNNSAQIFPGNLIAKIFGIKTMPYFEGDTKDNVSIQKLWNN